MTVAEGGIVAGTVLVGKYRIETVLGHGGMGMVYRAHHLALDEAVAIKVLRRDVRLDDDAVHRFVREAQAAVKLKSEHVARVSDVGTFGDDQPYMVMEFLDGIDLGKHVERDGPMAPDIAADLLLQACDAIAEAHALGIVHRDLKPENLFVAFRPDNTAVIKVLDFGISKTVAGADLSLTQTSSMLGTPAYMSPEQMRSARTVDARTDIWSLGTVLYELVEGRKPFEAESFSEMCVMVAADPHAPMVNAPELEPVIERCLAKRPEERYESVAALARDLATFASNREAARRYVKRTHRVLGLPVPAGLDSSPVIARPERFSAPAMVRTAAPTVVDDVPASSRERRRGWLIAAVAIVIGVGGGLAVLAATADRDPPDVTSAAGSAASAAPVVPADASIEDATTLAGASVDAAPVDAGVGSAATVAPPRPARPTAPARPTRPPKRPPPDPTPPPAPVVTKPKCDPFSSRTNC